ncbi:MAG: hypothetical protein KDK54_09470 [Leptospiraceae bacterium]|nr:hypothetical protein [Leptospiraceae bacterium]
MNLLPLILSLCIFFINGTELSLHPLSKYSDSRVLENFENFQFSEKNIIFHGNSEIYPEIKLTSLFTSPYMESNSSLLFRIPSGARFESIEVLLSTPYLIPELALELEFHLYSTARGGELYFFVEDSASRPHKVSVSRIQFTGWKKIFVPMLSIPHEDFVLNEKKPIKITGFLLKPPPESEKSREFLVVIDNILLHHFNKYKIRP